GIPSTNPLSAALEGLRLLGARRLALLTPYPAEVNAAIERYLCAQGFAIPEKGSFALASDSDAALVPPEAIHDAALELGRAAVDAVFIAATALRVSPVLEQLEAALGKPVVASNQTLAWRCLRLAGRREPVAGFGRLLTL
ncbi:MAG: hypothetical protein ACREGL_03240, partial [Alphaproteobacteria bacterium]